MNVVLNFGPRHDPDHDHDRSDRVYLVWPAAAWRVVAPLPSERRLNMLQKAVLGVLRGAFRPANEIASKLHLHPRLVEAIGRELVSSGWVDQTTWRPTAKGLAMLDEEDVAMEAIVSGWVFQDPWTGDLWPFFARQLRLQETVPVFDPTRLALVFDNAKGTRRTQAWALGAPQVPGQPTTGAILDAVRRFRRREKLKGAMRFLASEVDRPVTEAQPSILSRITFVSDQPESVGLVTYVYVPQDGGLAPQVCDPFGIGYAARMYLQLQRIANVDEAASGAIRDILRLANAQDLPAMEENLKRQRQASESYIIERLSLDIKQFPSVFEHIVEVQHAISLAVVMGNNPQGQLASSIQFCRKAYEAVLKEALRRSSIRSLDDDLDADLNKSRAKLEGVVAALGFSSPMPQELRDSIQGKGSSNDIRKVLRRIIEDLDTAHQLKGMIVALLLAANKDVVHPLRHAARRAPDLLATCMRVTSLGNPASHDTLRRFTVADAVSTRELTLEVLACLLNLQLKPNDSRSACFD